MHVIEAIGVQEPRNMSSIARAMDVTVGTLTIAMNSLVKKGYVTRTRSEKDRRVVFIALTEKGKKAYDHHQRFHREMIDAVLSDLTEEETQVLARALEIFSIFPGEGTASGLILCVSFFDLFKQIGDQTSCGLKMNEVCYMIVYQNIGLGREILICVINISCR